MKWPMPPKIKIYEALGAIGDGRLELESDSTAKLFSSSGGKSYSITFDNEKNEIYANDNASFFAGYLGYPAIAFLFAKGILPYSEEVAVALKGIPWKDINQRYKNDFSKTMIVVDAVLESDCLDPEKVSLEADKILLLLEKLGLEKPAKRTKPPKGY
jgi:hypothetical protein